MIKETVLVNEPNIIIMKLRVGHKKNSCLNGEWAQHTRRDGKKRTSGLRRLQDKKIIREELEMAKLVDAA